MAEEEGEWVDPALRDQEEFVLPEKRTWVDVQKKTFTGWCNTFLSERGIEMTNMEDDMEDGIALIALLEEISGGKKIRHNNRPKMRVQKVENCGNALEFIKSEGIKLVNIGPENLVDKNLKLDLGLIWTLILRYQIQRGGDDSGKKELLEWVNKMIAPYGKQIGNFAKDWTDGTVMSALSDALKPGSLFDGRDLGNLSGNPVQDIDAAMEHAQDAYDIPKLLDPEDMHEVPDELSTMTYVSYFRDWYENRGNTDAGNTYADGPGLESGNVKDGEETYFTIHSVDAEGNPRGDGGDEFDVSISGPNGDVDADVTDNGDGTYTVKYKPEDTGTHTIDVKLGEDHIKDAPFTVEVVEGTDASQSTTRFETTVTVQSKDKHGNPKSFGGDRFEVFIKGGDEDSRTDAEASDNGDGTYSAHYVLEGAGKFKIHVKINGKNVKGSPFRHTNKEKD